MSESILTAIRATLAFFDIWHQPLTAEELYRLLWSRTSYAREDFFAELTAAVARGDVVLEDDYYSLPTGGEANSTLYTRHAALRYSMKKYRWSLRVLRWVAAVPYVRAVFVANTVAAETAHAESDIDIVIVVRHGRVWIARLLVLALLDLLRVRHGSGRKNVICPTFFVADSALAMQPLALGEPDIYLVYWLLQLVPAYDPDDLYDTLMRANTWVRSYVPHGIAAYHLPASVGVRLPWGMGKAKRFFEIAWQRGYGDIVNKQAKEIQWPRLKRTYGELADLSDSRVVIRDDIVKLHNHDRREEYRKEWQARYRKATAV